MNRSGGPQTEPRRRIQADHSAAPTSRGTLNRCRPWRTRRAHGSTDRGAGVPGAVHGWLWDNGRRYTGHPALRTQGDGEKRPTDLRRG